MKYLNALNATIQYFLMFNNQKFLSDIEIL